MKHRAFRTPVAALLLITFFTVVSTSFSFAQTWNKLASDPPADGQSIKLPDATGLYYFMDDNTDSLWFKVTVGAIDPSHFTLYLSLLIPDRNLPEVQPWFGKQNTTFLFNKLVTVQVEGRSGDNFTGTFGMADAVSALAGNYTNLSKNNITIKTQFKVATAENAIIVGFKKSDFYTGILADVYMIGAVGIDSTWNDDIPNDGQVSPVGSMAVNQGNSGNADGLKLDQNQVFEHGGAYRFEVTGAEMRHLRIIGYNVLGQEVLRSTQSFVGAGLHTLTLSENVSGEVLLRFIGEQDGVPMNAMRAIQIR